MTIPFVDLRTQYQQLAPEIKLRINKVLEHGNFIMGPEVAEFEEQCSRLCDFRQAIAVGNGTDALLLPLIAWGVGPGDAVFVPAFTFVATANVVALLGATPVFVDIDPRTYTMAPSSLKDAIGKITDSGELRPKCVIPVDLFGIPANYSEIQAIARRHDLLVIEDAAQSFGAASGGVPAGGFGDVAGVSFFPSKPLGAYGDAGMILTGDDHLAGRLRSVRLQGRGLGKNQNVRVGLNSRMDTIQAAVLLAKLSVFSKELMSRRQVAQRYTEGLRDLVVTPIEPEGVDSAWSQYSILVQDRETFRRDLWDNGISTKIYYPTPLHLQKSFSKLGYEKGDFQVAEDVADRVVSLPIHGYLTEATVDRVVDAVRGALR